MTEAIAPDMPQSIKMGQTEGVGCMAVLGGIDLVQIRNWLLESLITSTTAAERLSLFSTLVFLDWLLASFAFVQGVHTYARSLFE